MADKDQHHPPPQAKRILIVDDDTDFNLMLTDVLQMHGYAVSTSEDPRVAITLIEETQSALVISDTKMPQMSGERFLSECRKRYPNVPVMMVSGAFSEEERTRLKSAGASYLIPKPLNLLTVIDKIQTLLER